MTSRARRSIVLGVATIAACGGGARRAAEPAASAPDRIAIVAAEAGPEGARLVAIDESGDRQFQVVQPAATVVRDSHPAVSPDGAWIVFASTRDRARDETSLWIAHAGVASAPRRLTDGAWMDAHPVWVPDGSAVVFASTRAHGNYDLWRLALTDGQPGALSRLTTAETHEVTPTVAADGAIIYAAVTPDEAHRSVELHLEERAPDGAIRRLTSGPADSSPALSPDGTRLAFARPRLRDREADSDLWLLDRKTTAVTPLIDVPLTDESGPVWSRDGRFVFATSGWRGETGRMVFSSIIYVDVRETPQVARLLEDRVGAIVRLTPALTATPLDAATLHRGPEYLPELARIMRQAIERQIERQTERQRSAP